MTLKKRFRNFVIGKDHYLPSLHAYRNALLRGQVSLLAFFIGFFYIIIDALYGVYASAHLYTIVMVFAAIAFVLNRHKQYITSTIVLLTMANGVVFVFVASEGIFTGVHNFFIANSMASLTLFGYRRKRLAFIFAFIPLLLFGIAHWYEFKIFTPPAFSEHYIRVNSLVNFVGSLLACILGIYFLLQINFHSENTLKSNQTKLFKLSDELKQNQIRLETAIKGSQAGIYEWNLNSGEIFLSKHWKELLGYSDGDVMDMTVEKFKKIVHPDDAERIRDAINEHVVSMEPYQNELRLKTKSGEFRWYYDSGLCIADAAGKPNIIIGSIIDITERKNSEAQIIEQNRLLAKANDELDRFVYSASHDLRAPLSSLLGLISIAKRTDRQEEIAACLSMMEERVNTMDGFIREITDYSRNSRLEVSREPIALHKLIHGIIENLRYVNGASSITIHVGIPTDTIIQTDPGRLKVILNNLISNALKYQDTKKPDQKIEIGYTLSGQRSSIYVRDNGQGIAPEHQSKIFNMFYRASENSDGSGLGLYIVKETLDKLGGSILVESEPEKGSTFTIFLPA